MIFFTLMLLSAVLFVTMPKAVAAECAQDPPHIEGWSHRPLSV
jgi:hypothetical protein